MMRIARGGHLPLRATWVCTCGEPWPCEPVRVGLLDEYAEARSALIMLMLATFAEAVHDLPDARAGDLFDRFLAWPWPTR